jgi:hypothetical protein
MALQYPDVKVLYTMLLACYPADECEQFGNGNGVDDNQDNIVDDCAGEQQSVFGSCGQNLAWLWDGCDVVRKATMSTAQ